MGKVETAFFYTDRYFSFDYGASHPLKIERLKLTYELCRAYGLFELPGAKLLETEPASEADILRFHTPQYVEVLKRAEQGLSDGNYAHGLGPGDNPVFPGLWQWSLLHTGASLQCARLVSSGQARIAFNIAGGLHHAAANRASGFCYVNDVVLAIYHLLDQGKRVLYLDVDAHHGDGVQWAFYGDPRVLTVSFHQDGRTLFPGTGAASEKGRGEGLGYCVNVPLYPGTDDEVFWKGFEAVVPRLFEAFRPDVVVSQLGVDTLESDPLAHLEMTTNGFSKVARYLTDQAPAWVALGGGGYDLGNVARCWTLAWAIMNRVDLPDELPDPVRPVLARLGACHGKLRDAPHRSHWHDRCLEHLDHVLRYLEEDVLPRIR